MKIEKWIDADGSAEFGIDQNGEVRLDITQIPPANGVHGWWAFQKRVFVSKEHARKAAEAWFEAAKEVAE